MISIFLTITRLEGIDMYVSYLTLEPYLFQNHVSLSGG